MKGTQFISFTFLLILSACASENAQMEVMLTSSPISTETILPTAIPLLTQTSKPSFTATPTPTSVINDANFLPPVDSKIVPLYNAFDLNEQKDKIEIQSTKYPPRTNFQCNGRYFSLGTPDNHFGWDFGTGNCSKHLVGTKVYGMSVGFYGAVISVGAESEKYAIKINYGKIRCTDGKVRHIDIQFAHSIPLVKVGDFVDSTIAIAELEEVSVEIEILVFGDGSNLDPQLIGLILP